MEGYISEIRMFAGNFAPRNWAYCQGQILSIASNSALFSLLGTTYGGNGVQTFGLPTMAGRQARGTGNVPGLPTVQLGEISGSENAMMTIANMPAHNHTATLMGSSTATTSSPANANFGPVNIRVGAPAGITASGNLYGIQPSGPANPGAVVVTSAGGSQPFSLMNPTLGMNFIICLFGIYPSRN